MDPIGRVVVFALTGYEIDRIEFGVTDSACGQLACGDRETLPNPIKPKIQTSISTGFMSYRSPFTAPD